MAFGLSGAAVAGLALGAATLYSSSQQADASQAAANTQAGTSLAGIAEQQRQFDAIQKLLAPYANAGQNAITAQSNLIGLNGVGPQSAAIDALKTSPQFTAYKQLGENAILQNASATGGLRGGNTEGALAQFQPQLLAQLIEQQFGNLGGITAVGQNAAAGTGNAGMASANAITQLLQQQGAAIAGGQLAQGRASAAIPNAIAGGLGVFTGLGGKF